MKNYKKLSLLLFLVLIMMFSNIAQAQEQKNFTIDKLSVEGRADFDYFNNDNSGNKSGFDGKFFNFEMKGTFLDDFSYRIRQRIDMADKCSKTDFMILSYHANKNFSVTAGKMPLAVGGWEYDLPPIDVYFASMFWNNFACYNVGAQLEYHSNNKKHDIIFQVTNSTFTPNKFDGMYAYNLIWYGNVGPLKTSYSINMMEQNKGEYINYIALGNDFNFGKLHLVLDFINRGFFNQSDFLFGSFSLIGEVKYSFTDKFTFMAKGGYDRNKHTYLDYSGIIPHPQPYDLTVAPGVEYTFGGLGFESYPYKGNQNVRVHGFVALNDLNDPADDMLNPNSTNLSLQFNLGVTWRINFVK